MSPKHVRQLFRAACTLLLALLASVCVGQDTLRSGRLGAISNGNFDVSLEILPTYVLTGLTQESAAGSESMVTLVSSPEPSGPSGSMLVAAANARPRVPQGQRNAPTVDQPTVDQNDSAAPSQQRSEGEPTGERAGIGEGSGSPDEAPAAELPEPAVFDLPVCFQRASSAYVVSTDIEAQVTAIGSRELSWPVPFSVMMDDSELQKGSRGVYNAPLMSPSADCDSSSNINITISPEFAEGPVIQERVEHRTVGKVRFMIEFL